MVRRESLRQVPMFPTLRNSLSALSMKPPAERTDARVACPAFWRLLQVEHAKPAAEVWAVGVELPNLDTAVCAFLFIGRGIVGHA